MPNKVNIHSGPDFSWYVVTLLIPLLWGFNALFIWLGINLLVVLSVFLYLRYRHVPIIISLLDSDWYKFTMCQVVFHQFPEAVAVYKFFNRGKTEFPSGFKEALQQELKHLSKLSFTEEELDWLSYQGSTKGDYIYWLSHYHFNPSQVHIEQDGGNLDITINGPWVSTILWEVPLMAIISELYFKLTGKTFNKAEFINITDAKACKMFGGDVKWSDFGTRRRFSKETQEIVNATMLDYAPNFIGTSNPYFAMKYNLQPIGTFAHEACMAMQAKYTAAESNIKWMEHWWEEYKNSPHLLTALTDTLTTDVFLRTYTGDMLNKYTGVRQDSGDPFEFGHKLLAHYKKHNINPKEKKIVFSDSLDADKACELQKAFGNDIPCVMGIGTNLTNSCGHKPLNMVIKLVGIDFGDGMKSVVKLSDDKGKHTGDNEKIELIKKELGIHG